MGYKTMVIKDAELQEASEKFRPFFNELNDVVKQYKTALLDVSNNAIKSGKTHDALVTYLNYVDKLVTVVGEIGGVFENITYDFLDLLDGIDDYLYEPYANVERDFSDEQYNYLVECLDDPWCEMTDNWGDKLLQGLSWLFNLKEKINNCHKLLLDLNDETKSGLKSLFDEAHDLDFKYGHSVSGGVSNEEDFYTAYFSALCMALCGIRDLLKEMATVIDPVNGSFTPIQVEARLGNAYREMMDYYDQSVEISRVNESPTIPVISDFASQPWARSYFSDFNYPIDMYIMDIGGYEAFKMVVYNMFQIGKDHILHSDYEKYMTKKHLLEVLETMGEGYHYSESDEKKNVALCGKFLGYVKKYGKDWYEKLDKRTREAKQFKEFLESLGNAQDILNYGSAGIDYLARLFTDYSAGLETIESFRRNCDDPVMLESVAEIEALYKKEFGAWAKEAWGVFIDKGFDRAMQLLGKKCSVLAVVSAIDEGIQFVGNVTGDGAKSESMYHSLVFHDLCASSSEAYQNALEKFIKMKPEDEGYEQAAQDLSNCFNMHKLNTVKLYEAMENASTGDKRSYYHYCAKQAKMMSMHDNQAVSLMSYEEYLELGER